ncbi:MAG: S66 family peptidase [Culicoidibacterales bacterium]
MQPSKLEVGDTIAIFSPSAAATAWAPKRTARARMYLETKGFKVLSGKLTAKQDCYRSGSIQERAEELNELLRNPEVNCIMATIGGMNSNSLLPYLDYEAFARNPKIIIGYSDVTAILLALYAKTGITTYYGPAFVASFGEFPPLVEQTYDYWAQIVMQDIQYPYQFQKPSHWTDERLEWETQIRGKQLVVNTWETVIPGCAQGRLIGGNLNTMQGFWGSEFFPEIRPGDILLIEDSLKDAATIERSFSFLKVNGVFDRVGGILLGKHEQFDDQGTGRKPSDILLEVIGETTIPILAEFDCCHTHPMLTLPLGSHVRVDATKQTVTLLELAE